MDLYYDKTDTISDIRKTMPQVNEVLSFVNISNTVFNSFSYCLNACMYIHYYKFNYIDTIFLQIKTLENFKQQKI